MPKNIACLGDPSTHGGSLITTNQNNKFSTKNVQVCANGCLHACPITGHGTTPVTAITVKSFVDGKLIVTEGAVAGCGAIITPPDRKMYVE